MSIENFAYCQIYVLKADFLTDKRTFLIFLSKKYETELAYYSGKFYNINKFSFLLSEESKNERLL